MEPLDDRIAVPPIFLECVLRNRADLKSEKAVVERGDLLDERLPVCRVQAGFAPVTLLPAVVIEEEEESHLSTAPVRGRRAVGIYYAIREPSLAGERSVRIVVVHEAGTVSRRVMVIGKHGLERDELSEDLREEPVPFEAIEEARRVCWIERPGRGA